MFKPMLAEDANFDTLRFPLYASPKIDGLRCTVHNGIAMSRSMKPLPNKWLQSLYSPAWNGLDGELTVGDPGDANCYRRSTSMIMSNDKTSFDWTFWVFDICDDMVNPYRMRLDQLEHRFNGFGEDARICRLSVILIKEKSELDDYEQACLEAGLEGVITRDPEGLYKQGRSTAKEQGMLKVKRSADMEARVVGVAEQMHNTNEAFKSEIGRTKRSSAKVGLVGKNTMGALMVRGLNGPYAGVEFDVGTGFDDAERQSFWDRRQEILTTDTIVKIGYFPLGAKDKPRHPTFLGLRGTDDMD